MNKKILIGILIGIVIVGSFIFINYWKSQKIKVSTDKSVYFSEPIELTIKSGLDKPVFITPTFSIRIEVEDDQIYGEKWRPLKTIVGTGCNCFLNLKCDEKGFTIPPQIKINPHSFYNLSLNPDCFFEKNKKYRIQVMPSIQIGKGKFKHIGFYYSNEFLVKEPQVTIKTDKTEYKQGEEVKIIAINNLGKSIWYAKRLDGCKCSFWELEKFAKGKWKKVDYHPFVLCLISDFGFTELESKEKLEEIWDGYVWISEESKEYKRKTADSGKYRVIFYYSLENISRFDPYFKKRIKIYSNEFIIKEPTSKKCIPEGGTLFPNDGNKCCVGLSPRWNYEIQEDGSCKSISGSSGHQLICVKCGNGVCGEGENGCNCPKDCKDFKCKEHGEIPIFFPGDDMSIQCCKGLKHRLRKEYFDENCTNLFEKYGGGGYAGICLACGDGICDEKFESKCNCPEDCK